jgi:spermidine synthase
VSDGSARLSRPLVHALFFASGAAALLYQVLWVREFGNRFGNGVWSTALVTALFMAGLGVGGQLGGRVADRRPHDALRLYGLVELGIGGWGLVVALALPWTGNWSSWMSAYGAPAPWLTLTLGSWLGRALLVTVLVLPSTLLMGATLTLLLRHVLASDLGAVEGWRTGALYGVNTLGAAMGALLADFVAIPQLGAFGTQIVAVAVNLVIGALVLARSSRRDGAPPPDASFTPRTQGLTMAGLALALSGFVGMGLEVTWFRYFSSALGGYRSVFALLLVVLLVSMWLGASLAGLLVQRVGSPGRWQVLAQAGLGVVVVVPLATLDVEAVREAQRTSGFLAHLVPIAKGVLLPGVLMGAAFPLMNALVQQAGAEIGRRAGSLYLFNTVGAVLGSLGTGFLLIPALGVQRTLLWLLVLGAVGLLPLFLAARTLDSPDWPRLRRLTPVLALVALVPVGGWASRPKDALLFSAFVPGWSDELELLEAREGPNEVAVVAKWPGVGLALMTNGHNMSGTTAGSQRYMRAMAHLPLLLGDAPRRALVICFGVGNTVHAASLHPLERLDVAELSPDVLALAHHFREANHDVLADPRVAVHVNDGRQHLRMQPEGTYDLITLEPPPITYAGLGSLYSREFYALAKGRLTEGGFLTQWLPVYQVPSEIGRAMIASFVAEFPDAVLLSGWGAELILMGRKGAPPRLDLAMLRHRLEARPGVKADLERIKLSSDEQLATMYVASGQELRRYVQGARLVTDDRPLNEFTPARARFPMDRALFSMSDIAGWCDDCLPWAGALETTRTHYQSDTFLTTAVVSPP